MGFQYDDDVPVAIRSEVPAPKARTNRLLPWAVGGAIAVVAIGTWAIVQRPTTNPDTAVTPAETETAPSEALLGHRPYADAPAEVLTPLASNPDIRLRSPAAKAFDNLQAAAAREGIRLLPLSGFRSKQDQQALFFDVKAERNQSVTERASVSAPPGYSEHHTGYAIDIGDADQPATHLETTFEQTAAFRWLQANAKRFSFELSFPRNNSQQVSYEPWHWRFVGDVESLRLFYGDRGTPAAQ
ncbi:M15 family metallopeptidase [Synechococcus elongatus]|uniref:M15 family metallopeptidase n=1 Tax=Synechococcus elongatus PCC 11802 TaxID=2283154 RepID=A0AAT9JZI3_SYNEL|nr:M15 family metallopeptidase [Synechococcus elongatus]QFZ92774.1 D-alanyl-D-alanine carboxypeptidase family protein [Synechococcus elongatus PCC 11802]